MRQRTEAVINALVTEGVPFSSGAFAARAGISRQTANYHLRHLMRDGMVFPSGRGRGVLYLPRGAVAPLLERLRRTDPYSIFTNAKRTTWTKDNAAAMRHWGSVNKGLVPTTKTG